MSFAQQVEEISVRLQVETTCRHMAVGIQSTVSPVLSETASVMVTFQSSVPVAVCQGVNPTAVFPVSNTLGHDVIPAGNKIRAMVSAGCRIAAVAQESGVMYLTVEGGV